MKIYLDYAASTPIWPSILEQHQALAEKWFCNPHGTSCFSELAMQEIIKAEKRLLQWLHIPEKEAFIIWTSGGTEANNLALSSLLKEKLPFYLVDSTAHASQLHCWPQADKITVDPHGQLIPTEDTNRGALAICLVNNETGVIQDLKALRQAYPKAFLAVDAVQALGKTTILWQDAKIDYLSVGGRKIGGPRAIGALIVRKGNPLHAQLLGGNQQRGWRSGTLDTVGILEFVKALELILADQTDYSSLNLYLRQLLSEILPCRLEVITPEDKSTPKILTFSVPEYQGAILVRSLAEAGIMIATGSACRAESGETNHAFKAMGYPEEIARGGIRFSLGAQTTKKDLQESVEIFASLIKSY